MNNNPVTEDELKAKATGRRVTLEDVNDAIATEHFFRGSEAILPGQGPVRAMSHATLQCMTFCVLVLTNGFSVTGQSACADPANYNKDIGERIARQDAVGKIWPLLGFLLKEDIARDWDLVSKRAFAEMPDFGVFIGTKVVHATPMSRAVYNDFRGWTMPANENDDEGYLVEYTDGGQSNVEGYAGYISWSPKDVFERSYRAVGQDASASEPAPGRAGTGASDKQDKTPAQQEETFIDRLYEERRQLSERCAKLGAFLEQDAATLLPVMEEHDLREQKKHMDNYLMILNYRIARLPGEYPKTSGAVPPAVFGGESRASTSFV